MLKLSDFFQPLNFTNLCLYVAAVFFFDVIGSFVKRLFVKNKEVNSETRLVNWLIGLGLFVAIWFVLGLFTEPIQANILISALVLLIVFLPFYIKNKCYLSLVGMIKLLIFPIALVIPLLPPTFVKASLPPYSWDEMAYHFISPYSLLHNINHYWQYAGGLYENVPRLMDTLYILSFSVFQTYSIVRLLQFSVLITALFSAYLIIKKLFGQIPSLLFVLIYLSLPLKLPDIATTGYVDVPAFAFLLLGTVFGITFLFSEENDYLILSSIFWAMSIGTKYTTLSAFAAFLISFCVTYFVKNRKLSGILDRKTFFKITLVLLVFGGYWYIKNFIVYGNPIYPFFFPCWGRFAAGCAKGSSFFGTWTMPVNVHTFYPIIKDLFPENIILRIVLFISPLLVIFLGDKKRRLLLLFFCVSLFLEFGVMKYFSGFASRYQQYLNFTLIFITILFVTVKSRFYYLALARVLLLFALSSSCIFVYFWNVRYLYTLNFVTWNEINYSIGRENIYDWVKNIFPDVSGATIWCENPPNGPVALANYDPDIIWYGYGGLMRVYLLGCYYGNPNLVPDDWKDIVSVAKERKLKFWTVSVNRCLKPENVVPKAELKDSNVKGEEFNKIVQMRRLNNAIVCNSIEVAPNLYYFDYEKLK